jgi:hypothetical protein
MRRTFVTATLCAAILLLAAASAVATPRYAARGVKLTAHNVAALNHGRQAPVAYVPLARRILSGTGTISLNVYTWNSLPEAGARADWWVYADTYVTGHGTTDASGHVDLTRVPAATTDNGEVAVALDSADNGAYDLWNMSWGDTGWSGALQAGRLPVDFVPSGQRGWNTWTGVRTWLWSHQASATEVHQAATNIARAGSSAAGYARTIQTGPETLYGGAAYFWDNEGLEMDVDGIAVGPGQDAAAAPTAYEADAQRLLMGNWGSGKPGSAAWVLMNNYPDAWSTDIYGVADYPSSAKMKSFGNFTNTGAEYDPKRIIIPSTAAPGYAYWIEASHTDGPLDLWTSFQVCTLKPSKSAVSGNSSITFGGVVPIKGHYGSQKGTPKYVTIYKTTSAKVAAKGQPSVSGGRTVKSWTKVGRVRTDGLGKYKLSTRPGKTTWYCAWYAADSWYWGAWTSVAKVTVR